MLWLVPLLLITVGLCALRLVQASRNPVRAEPLAARELPSFPGAYKFKAPPQDGPASSMAYLVKDATIEDVARYYRESLTKDGYRLEQDQVMSMPVPGEKVGQPSPRRPGKRLVFTNDTQKRMVMVMAIAQPYLDAQTQVAVMAGPLPKGGFASLSKSSSR